MADMVDMGRELFGSRPEAPSTRTITALAAADSRDGVADLYIGGERMPVACLAPVAEGDDVVVTLMGRRPVVLGAKGWGDGVVADIEQAKDAIEQAEAEADAARKEIAKVEGDLKGAIDTANGIIDDMRGEIETVSNTMEADYAKKEIEATLRSEMSQSAAEIRSEVALQYATKGEQAAFESKFEQTATGIRSEVSAVVTDVEGVKSAVSKVEQTALGIEASIDLMAEGIEDAKRYATNYLSWTASAGLVIGNRQSSTLGGNVQVTSTGVNIRDGEAVNASFTAQRVSLLGGKGAVFVASYGENGSNKMTMEGVTGTQLYYAPSGEESRPYGYVELGPSSLNGKRHACLTLKVGDDNAWNLDPDTKGPTTGYIIMDGPGYVGSKPATRLSMGATSMSLLSGQGGYAQFAKTLYSNQSGTPGTVELSESASLFSALRVCYGGSDGKRASVVVPSPDGKLAQCYLAGSNAGSAYYWWYAASWQISGRTLSPRYNGTWNHMTAAGTGRDEVRIYRVEGLGNGITG